LVSSFKPRRLHLAVYIVPLQQKASGGTPQHSAAHSDDYILLFIVCLRLGKVTFFCFLQIRSLSPPSPPGQIEVVIRTIIAAPRCTDSLLWSVLSNRDDYILLFTEFATTEGQQRNTATQCSTQRRLHLAVYSLPAFSSTRVSCARPRPAATKLFCDSGVMMAFHFCRHDVKLSVHGRGQLLRS
jgi:hypothetical protein